MYRVVLLFAAFCLVEFIQLAAASAQLNMNLKREQVLRLTVDTTRNNIDSIVKSNHDPRLLLNVALGPDGGQPAEIYCEFDPTDRLMYYKVTMYMDSIEFGEMLADFTDQTSESLLSRTTDGEHYMGAFRSTLCDERVDYFPRSKKAVIQRVRPGVTMPEVKE